jgi:2-oxoglutarate ferredoxin oxidoreductase subunit alpha
LRSIKSGRGGRSYTRALSDRDRASVQSVSIALSGSGGAGVMTAGELLLDAAARAGYFGAMSRSFGPQIRGGEAAALIRLGAAPVECPDDAFDLLIALDWGNIDRFAEEMPLTGDSLVVADPAEGDIPAVVAETGAVPVAVPMTEIARTVRGGRANLVALGLVASSAGIGAGYVEAAVRARFGRREARVLEGALGALRAGMADRTGPLIDPLPAPERGDASRWNLSGNEAAGLGAIRGGVRFVAGYPITPATDLLEWLAGALPKVGGTLVQAEDELASINMCLGASFGGTPSLTATSGPGLALMMETVGLAVASETPVVVIDVMRGGPSTGIPTKSEQTDLNIAVHGLHGDAPHPVLAPLDIADGVFTTQWAVQLAERLQTAVLVLSDQALAQSRAIVEAPARSPLAAGRAEASGEEPYRRYAVTGSGVSPMARPGTPGALYTAEGLEHDEYGRPSARASDHRAQLDKRRDKLVDHDYGDAWAEVDGDGALAVITWGSATRPTREAVGRLRDEGLDVRLVAVRLLSPARPAHMARALAGAERALVVEHNHDGQYLRLLRAEYELDVELEPCHAPGPLPLRPGELAERIRARHPRFQEAPA